MKLKRIFRFMRRPRVVPESPPESLHTLSTPSSERSRSQESILKLQFSGDPQELDTATILHIPIEILYEIIGHCNRPARKALSETCKGLRRVVLPYLFRRYICLYENVIPLIDAYPEVVDNIQELSLFTSLSLSNSSHRRGLTLKSLPKISNFTNVTTVTIAQLELEWDFQICKNYFDALRSLPNLEDLSIWFGPMMAAKLQEPAIKEKRQGGFISKLRFPENLKRLRVDINWMWMELSFPRMFFHGIVSKSLSTLQQLDVRIFADDTCETKVLLERHMETIEPFDISQLAPMPNLKVLNYQIGLPLPHWWQPVGVFMPFTLTDVAQHWTGLEELSFLMFNDSSLPESGGQVWMS
ncbi:hypothetical protein ABW19_dt0202596 [Dactylella cylindrospora]|nr:hypothetical protein ABW19_dt0202596 [Dactylella cylindrospora]